MIEQEQGHIEYAKSEMPEVESSQYLSAWIIATGILLGSIILSLSMFLSVRLLVKSFSQNSTGLAVQAPVAPSAAVQNNAGPTPTPGAPVNITLAANTPFLGNANAKVTVIEYADYQCPFCEQFEKNVWPQLKSQYVDTGKIKFVYQDFAFLGADSNTAGEAAFCAQDQNKFWEYHDYLFNHQGQENSGWATADKQKLFAGAVGLNTSQFSQCLTNGKHKQDVLNQTAAGKTYGVTGTPTVFVNGVSIVGAQPYNSFKTAIDNALK